MSYQIGDYENSGRSFTEGMYDCTWRPEIKHINCNRLKGREGVIKTVWNVYGDEPVTDYTIKNAENEKMVVGFYRDHEEDDKGCAGNVWAIHLNGEKICHHLLHYIMKNN